jgi:general stress protein YciG
MSERRGFAAMEETKRRQIASRGGRAAHEAGNAHEWNEREATEAGRKGGQKVSRNREHMAAIGRKGGLAAHHRDQSASPQPQPAEQQHELGRSDVEPAQASGQMSGEHHQSDAELSEGQSLEPHND